ncbi:MAG TPA: hypothetical protein VGS20_14695 [Candidatus Acidoferrales bacterium]|nr:hypothetical protein [Candidatus Acidoferrales bacterium]
MVEFYTVKKIDNSRLTSRCTRGTWRVCGRQVMIGGLVALALLVYAWQHYQCLRLSYALEQLNQAQSQVAQLNRQLRTELAALDSPQRIDLLARDRLGMIVPVAAQIVQTQPPATGDIAQASAAAVPSSFR